jgi:hypothetical protein
MDGAEVDSINSVGSIDITTEDVRIGWGWADSQCWNGIVDEVRLSNIARGPEWIKTSYNSENDTLLTYGSEEVLSSVTVTFTERGRIKMVGVTDKETTRSRIKTTGLTKKETLKGRIKISQTTRNQTIRGKIKGLGTIRKETSRGRIKESGITKTETLKAKIKGLGILVTETSRGKIKASTSKTSSMRAKIIKQRGLRARINRINVSLADIRATIKGLGITKLLDILARIKSVNSKTLQARGFIVDIGKTYLYAPPTGSYSNIPVAFKWYIPSNRWGKDMSFEIQIDKTNDTFNDLEADVFSFSNPGMEYFDGANWNSISSTGVPSTYSGNLARFITNLTNGLKYWRVRAFVG